MLSHAVLHYDGCHAGDHRPCSTTLLAFFWHAGALYAIPDLPRVDQGGSRRAGKMAAAGYQLLRLDMDTKEWQRIACQVGWKRRGIEVLADTECGVTTGCRGCLRGARAGTRLAMCTAGCSE